MESQLLQRETPNLMKKLEKNSRKKAWAERWTRVHMTAVVGTCVVREAAVKRRGASGVAGASRFLCLVNAFCIQIARCPPAHRPQNPQNYEVHLLCCGRELDPALVLRV